VLRLRLCVHVYVCVNACGYLITGGTSVLSHNLTIVSDFLSAFPLPLSTIHHFLNAHHAVSFTPISVQ
jgi:hypothetical protein